MEEDFVKLIDIAKILDPYVEQIKERQAVRIIVEDLEKEILFQLWKGRDTAPMNAVMLEYIAEMRLLLVNHSEQIRQLQEHIEGLENLESGADPIR